MSSRCVRTAGLLALLALGSSSALAFETVDTILWPSAGAFPAYEGDAPRPWGLRAYAGAMYDDNVTRIPVNERGDLITRFGIGGNYAARVYGRQGIRLDAYGEWRDYQDLDLDHFAYGTTAEWLWELGNQLAGTVGWRRIHRMEDPGESRVVRKQLVTEDRVDATGAYAISPDFRLTGGLGALHVERDDPIRTAPTTNDWAARGGIEYVSGLANTAGIEVRYGEGDAPVEDILVGFFPTNRYTQRDVAFTLAYNISADLRVRGRLGHTWREYTDTPESDFSGPTGRGLLEWRMGVKTLFVFELVRAVDPIIDADALHVDRRGAAVGLLWAATAKLVFGARFSHERRLYEGDPSAVLLGGPLRDDTVRLWRFHAGWEPERHWQVSTALDFGDRDSNILGQNYEYTAVTFNLRYDFR
ncbi:MAG TPA: hypothetical protein VFZ54_12810 [Burkholderiales bacterium]